MDFSVILKNFVFLGSFKFNLIIVWLSKVTPSGKVKITINGDQTFEVDGGYVTFYFSSQGIFLPSACGGGTLFNVLAKYILVVEVFFPLRNPIFQETNCK